MDFVKKSVNFIHVEPSFISINMSMSIFEADIYKICSLKNY